MAVASLQFPALAQVGNFRRVRKIGNAIYGEAKAGWAKHDGRDVSISGCHLALYTLLNRFIRRCGCVFEIHFCRWHLFEEGCIYLFLNIQVMHVV